MCQFWALLQVWTSPLRCGEDDQVWKDYGSFAVFCEAASPSYFLMGRSLANHIGIDGRYGYRNGIGIGSAQLGNGILMIYAPNLQILEVRIAIDKIVPDDGAPIIDFCSIQIEGEGDEGRHIVVLEAEVIGRASIAIIELYGDPRGTRPFISGQGEPCLSH